MTRLLWLFAKIAVIAALAVWLAENPGTVRIDWQGWVVEMQLGLLALGVLIASVVLAVAWRFWVALRRSPGALADMRRSRRHRQGLEALTQGLVAVAAGNAREAERLARRADLLLDEPLLSSLLLVQATQLGGDEAEAAKRFQTLRERPATAFLGVRGLLGLAIRRGDWDKAEALAEEAYRLRPDSTVVIRELYEIRRARGDVPRALTALDRAIKVGVVDKEHGEREKALLLMREVTRLDEAGDTKAALKAAAAARRLDPALVSAVAEEARLLGVANRRRQAEKLIEEHWPRMASPTLARCYAALAGDSVTPLGQVKRFETLHALAPDRPESHVALAEAALKADLWGEARKHLMMAGGDAPDARVCRLMAELEEREHGDTEAARNWLARAAAFAVDVQPALPVPDGARTP